MALTPAHREVLESLRTMVDIQVGLLSVISAKECKGLEARIFLLGDMSTLLLRAVIILDRWVFPWASNLRVSVNTHIILG